MPTEVLPIQLGNILTNSKGGKYIPLRGEGSDAPTWKSNWLKVIWNPSSYGDPEAVRVSMCLEPDEAARFFFGQMEAQMAKALSEHSQRDSPHLRQAPAGADGQRAQYQHQGNGRGHGCDAAALRAAGAAVPVLNAFARPPPPRGW